jgi:hypothetical protein
VVVTTAPASARRPAIAASALDPAAGIAAVLRRSRSSGRCLVLVDGPSGVGKSTFADRLLAAWPGGAARLVRLDHVYPGWHGLERGASALRRDLIDPLAHDAPGRWRRWDWAAGRPGALERMSPGRPLIVEGCGAFAAGAQVRGALRVWVTGPDGTRRRRALERDEGGFDEHWDAWEAQWRRHVARSRPDRRADVRLRMAGAGGPRAT